MPKLVKRISAAIGASALIILNFMVSGVIVAAVHQLRLLAYPAHFGFAMLQVGLIFLVVAPAASKHHWSVWNTNWFKNRVKLNPQRFEKPFWRWVRSRGSFVLMLVALLLVGPITMALIARFLGLKERLAWTYSFVSAAVGSLVIVSLYLGLSEILREILSLF